MVFERHSKTAVWLEGEADLSRFAGQRVRLQLESHPGPRNNTTNDQSYWAEPTLVAGQPPAPSAFPPRAPRSRCWATSRKTAPRTRFESIPAPAALLDSAIAFVTPSRTLSFRGFQVRVRGDCSGRWRSTSVLTRVRAESANGRYRVRHSFRNWFGTFDLVGELWVEGKALHAHWKTGECTRPAAVAGSLSGERRRGPLERHRAANLCRRRQRAAGPRRIHAAFRWAPALDILCRLRFRRWPLAAWKPSMCRPTYSMSILRLAPIPCSAAHEQTMTFIPGTQRLGRGENRGATCNGLHPAGGVSKLAGRFVFDLWSGNYAPSAAALSHAFHYGLTDADRRLAQLAAMGLRLPSARYLSAQSEAGFNRRVRRAGRGMQKERRAVCPARQLHRSSIPTPSGFSYDKIAFSASGTPVKAWFNKGREAQSYRWRADLLAAGSGKQCDRHSRPHRARPAISSTSGRRPARTTTGRATARFTTASPRARSGPIPSPGSATRLGDNAPQISESGHDQLIGALDGGQTNHLARRHAAGGRDGLDRLEHQGRRMPSGFPGSTPPITTASSSMARVMRIVTPADWTPRCTASTATTTSPPKCSTGTPPWFPRPWAARSCASTGYCTTPMRALALARFDSHEFAGGDLHRQHVKWEGGGEVWVNRGADGLDRGWPHAAAVWILCARARRRWRDR